MSQAASEAGLAALIHAILEDLPIVFDSDRDQGVSRLTQAGYVQTRQLNGLPMAEKMVGDGEIIALFATPEMPLPKAKWIAGGAADWFDRLGDALLARGFLPAPTGRLRNGMRIANFDAPGRGPVAAVTIMRLERSDKVLLGAAIPRSMLEARHA